MFAVAVFGIFSLAAQVEPDFRGYGTHEQLGLPACQFMRWTGWPCPYCGMTTSFSHFVRGQFAAAFRIHPCGPLLAGMLAALVLPWCLVTAVIGRPVITNEPVRWLLVLAIFYIVVVAGTWLIRLSVL